MAVKARSVVVFCLSFHCQASMLSMCISLGLFNFARADIIACQGGFNSQSLRFLLSAC